MKLALRSRLLTSLIQGLLSALLGLGILPFSELAQAATAKSVLALEGFDIKKAPPKADWRYFIKASGKERADLWRYHVLKGEQLKDWSWGWRLGWVRVCGHSSSELCAEILSQGLIDHALVVRAEAATRVGEVYAGTHDPQVVKRLAQAFGNSHNLRHGKPLYVQMRILYALKEVGGDSATATAEHLAASDQAAQAYWAKLSQRVD